jgi:peptidoglycan/LPS O-acetylase OafA/YrhL
MDTLLILRGLASIAVVIWHSGGHLADLPLINVPGRTAVWLFFGISGYVIAFGFINKRYLLNGPDLIRFFINRLLRIYPLFLLLSLLGWITIWSNTGVSPIVLSDIPSEFFGLQFNHAYKLNGVFWTLGLEVQFYAIAPALGCVFFIKKPSVRFTVAAFFYLSFLFINSLAVFFEWWSHDGRNIISVLPHFFVGMVGCSLVSSFKRSNRWAMGNLAGAFLCLILSNWLYHRQPELFWNMHGTLVVDIMILFFIFGHASLQSQGVKTSLHIKLLLLMGTLSYGIYAWHSYLLQFFSNAFVLLSLSTISAYLSYRLIELPAVKMRAHSIYFK